MSKEKLRLAILVNSTTIPAWAFGMLQRIEKSHFAEIVLFVVNNSNEKKLSKIIKIKSKLKQFVYLAYNKLEHFLYKPNPDAFEGKSILSLSGTYKNIKVDPRKTKFSDYILEKDIALIKEQKPDILIRLGFRILRGEILKVARLGLWSYHHGDNHVNRGGPAGIWEVLSKTPTTGSILQILSEDLDGGKVIYRSKSATHHISFRLNKNALYWKTLSFMPRMLERLYTLGESKFFDQVDKSAEGDFYSNRLFVKPNTIELLAGVFKNYFAVFCIKISKLYSLDQWILQYKFESKKIMSKSFFRFKKLMPPKNRFWADPFIVFKNNKYYIFFEELFYKKNKGHISFIELNKKGEYTSPEIILEKDYHLSYPFLFEDEGELYMIPESSANKNIQLYKCSRFPRKWDHLTDLLNDVSAVDSTMLKYNDTYWLFTNIRENVGAATSDELFLYYSDELENGVWQPHPLNPIVSDVTKARSAGKVFKEKGRMYRPSQNCSVRYGYAMKINEIKTLSKTDYKEEVVDEILPNWEAKMKGTHTINHNEKLTVIDSLIKRNKFYG